MGEIYRVITCYRQQMAKPNWYDERVYQLYRGLPSVPENEYLSDVINELIQINNETEINRVYQTVLRELIYVAIIRYLNKDHFIDENGQKVLGLDAKTLQTSWDCASILSETSPRETILCEILPLVVIEVSFRSADYLVNSILGNKTIIPILPGVWVRRESKCSPITLQTTES